MIGQTSLKAKHSVISIELPVQIIKDLIPDVILCHNFLDIDGVIIHHTGHVIFLGKDEWLRLALCVAALKRIQLQG